MGSEMCIRDSKSTDLDMQQDSIQSQLDIYKKQKSQYEKLVKSIQDDKNYFSETDIDDQPYYYQYETYKSQVAQKAFDASPYQAAGYSDEQIKALMEQNQSEVEALYYCLLYTSDAADEEDSVKLGLRRAPQHTTTNEEAREARTTP